MANKKISQLTEVINPTSTDVIPVVNASETKKAQLGNLPISDATQSALDGKQDTLGYTAENVANRSTDVDADKTSLTKYPVVKAVYDWAVSLFATISQLNTKQDTLVSGTNIKTINSESLLGSGNIAIDLSPISVDGDKVSIAADTTATTQTTAVIQATDTNSGIAIVPNGTGAITARIPDGTNTGGNARGQWAVDLQRGSELVSDRVASGQMSFVGSGRRNGATQRQSVVVGGEQNLANGDTAVVVGGQINRSSGVTSFLGAGRLNISSGNYSTLSGGYTNTNSSEYGVISGGQSNTASTNTHATVVGGYQNSSTGQYSVSGGYSNVASGLGSVALGYDNTASGNRSVAIGNTNTATGSGSTAFGSTSTASGESSFAAGKSTASSLYSTAMGESCIASGRSSVALGFRAKAYAFPSVAIGDSVESTGTGSFSFGIRSNAYLYAQCSYGANSFASVGDAQGSFLVRKIQDTLTSGATTTVASDLIPNDNNRVWNVTIKYTAVVTSITGTATGVSVGDCKNEVLTIGFKKIGGTSSVVGSLNTLSTNEDSSMSTASFGVTAGASQEMKLDFTAPTFLGGGSVTTRVVAKVELTEVAY